jgi:hypothetical protein
MRRLASGWQHAPEQRSEGPLVSIQGSGSYLHYHGAPMIDSKVAPPSLTLMPAACYPQPIPTMRTRETRQALVTRTNLRPDQHPRESHSQRRLLHPLDDSSDSRRHPATTPTSVMTTRVANKHPRAGSQGSRWGPTSAVNHSTSSQGHQR